MLLELFGARGVQSQVGRLLNDQPTMKGRDKTYQCEQLYC